ncbi:MAG: response regulator transcription factor [Acidimicrobiia bacterium]
MSIMVVEDDIALRETLSTILAAHDYDVVPVGTGEEAVHLTRTSPPELFLLDLGLPGIDGLTALERLRAHTDVPVIVLTVRSDRADKVAALDLGADDYVEKPFDTEELLARIRAALRRRPADNGPRPAHRVRDLTIDLDRRVVTRGDEPVHLTPTELRLLEVLLERDGGLVTHAQLASALGGDTPLTATSTRVFVAQLRKKLGDQGDQPMLIVNHFGLGYRWLAGGDADDRDADSA